MVGSGVYGLFLGIFGLIGILGWGNDSEFLHGYFSVQKRWQVAGWVLLENLSKRGVMCPLWEAIDTPCLIRGFIAQAIYLYDETKKRIFDENLQEMDWRQAQSGIVGPWAYQN